MSNHLPPTTTSDNSLKNSTTSSAIASRGKKRKPLASATPVQEGETTTLGDLILQRHAGEHQTEISEDYGQPLIMAGAAKTKTKTRHLSNALPEGLVLEGQRLTVPDHLDVYNESGQRLRPAQDVPERPLDEEAPPPTKRKSTNMNAILAARITGR